MSDILMYKLTPNSARLNDNSVCVSGVHAMTEVDCAASEMVSKVPDIYSHMATH